jgi:hypothetical protein
MNYLRYLCRFWVPVLALCGWAVSLARLWSLDAAAAPAVFISEFMADNQKTLHDEDGDPSDWIELYNADPASTVSLNGWFLTDDAGHLSKWRFPNVGIGPQQYLVVFA